MDVMDQKIFRGSISKSSLAGEYSIPVYDRTSRVIEGFRQKLKFGRIGEKKEEIS